MEKPKNINPEIFKYAESKNTQMAKKVSAWLDRDLLKGTITYNNCYWLESSHNIPMYVRNFIHSYMKKKGYRYYLEGVMD